jgi:hypothetical protein
MGLALFMATPFGRGLRIVVGLALIVIGISVIRGTGGWIIAIFGLLPITLGIINGCILAPILKVPFWGSKLPKA